MRIALAMCGYDTGEVSADVMSERTGVQETDASTARAVPAPHLTTSSDSPDHALNLYVAGERRESKPWPSC